MSFYKDVECYDNHELDCLRRCPRYYFYRIVCGKVKAGDNKLAAEFGIAIHYALELVAKGTHDEVDAIIEAVKYRSRIGL